MFSNISLNCFTIALFLINVYQCWGAGDGSREFLHGAGAVNINYREPEPVKISQNGSKKPGVGAREPGAGPF